MEAVFDSVFSSVDAFVYRCRNDSDCTMEHMAGQVSDLLGHDIDDLIDSKRVAFGSLTLDVDKDRVRKEMDSAIEAGKTWDLTYRVKHAQGHTVWVRERGSVLRENGEIVALQGLVVGANAEYALRAKLEASLERTGKASADIASLTTQITGSVKELSMLSINAGIEAARSGDAGKGFAVVASEMRALADRNAALAQKITSRVSDLRADGDEESNAA